MEIIASAAVTALAQWLKKYSPNEYVTVFMVLGISAAAAGIYTALVAANYWQTASEIFVTAGAIYTFIIQRFESASTADTASSNLG